MKALAFTPLGERVTVKGIRASERVVKHLCDMGLTVGSAVRPLQESGGNLILELRGGRLAMDKTLALKIQVETQGGNDAKTTA